MESRILKAYGASRIKEEDEDFERSNGPNRPRKRKSEYDEMGKRSKKHTTPTENLKNKKRKNKWVIPVKPQGWMKNWEKSEYGDEEYRIELKVRYEG